MAPWAELEGISRRTRSDIERGDVRTDPGDGSPPTNCPVCYERLDWRGDIGNCPYGHYRTVA